MTTSAALEQLRFQVGRIVAQRKARAGVRDFTRYAKNPIGFAVEVLKVEPWSAQRAIAEYVCDAPLTAVQSGNACGKDWIAAVLALWWVYSRRGFVLLTGPTERQVREICMKKVAQLWRRANSPRTQLHGVMHQLGLRVPGTGDAGILAFTSTDSSRLTGFHAPLVLGILTEAQGCEPFAFEGLLSCATGAEDRILAVGNPLTLGTRFHRVTRPGSGWVTRTISCLEHPNLTGSAPPIKGGPTRAFVDRIAQEYGKKSGMYAARILGQFPEEDSAGLFRRAWLEDAAQKWAEAPAPTEQAAWKTTIALDVGRDVDLSAAAVYQSGIIRALTRWGGAGDLMSTVDHVATVGAAWGVEPFRTYGSPNKLTSARGTIVVDAIGVGAGVHDRLREMHYRVESFNAGAKPRTTVPGMEFLNRRAEAYWTLRGLLSNGRLAMPRDEPLWEELLAMRWSLTPQGKMQIEPKDDLRARLGRSPDSADAVAMAVDQEGQPSIGAAFVSF